MHSPPLPPRTLVQTLDGSVLVLARLLVDLLGSGERDTYGTLTYKSLRRPPLACPDTSSVTMGLSEIVAHPLLCIRHCH